MARVRGPGRLPAAHRPHHGPRGRDQYAHVGNEWHQGAHRPGPTRPVAFQQARLRRRTLRRRRQELPTARRTARHRRRRQSHLGRHGHRLPVDRRPIPGHAPAPDRHAQRARRGHDRLRMEPDGIVLHVGRGRPLRPGIRLLRPGPPVPLRRRTGPPAHQRHQTRMALVSHVAGALRLPVLPARAPRPAPARRPHLLHDERDRHARCHLPRRRLDRSYRLDGAPRPHAAHHRRIRVGSHDVRCRAAAALPDTPTRAGGGAPPPRPAFVAVASLSAPAGGAGRASARRPSDAATAAGPNPPRAAHAERSPRRAARALARAGTSSC